MWMKSARLPYSDFTCSATSVTGPQTRLWQSAGVANRSTTGRCFFEGVDEVDAVHVVGRHARVDRLDVAVRPRRRSACGPRSPCRRPPDAALEARTVTCAGEVATSLRLSLDTADTTYEPADRNGISAT